MKKLGLVLILLVILSVASGCLGGEERTSTQSESSSTYPSSTLQTTTTEKDTTTSTGNTETESPGGYTREELLQGVSGITKFTYVANASIHMNVTVNQEGIVQRDSLNLSINEQGYLDFDGMKAWINTTTTSLPDGVSSNTSRIIIGDTMYIQTPVGMVEAEGGLGDPIWQYNLVSLAKRYLTKEPEEREENGELVLIYRLEERDAEALAKMYLALSPDAQVSIKWGSMVLRFKDGKLVGGAMSYYAISEVVITDPSIGNMTIRQEALWEESVEIREINEGIEISAPSI